MLGLTHNSRLMLMYLVHIISTRTQWHRWELPVPCYHGIRSNYHYSFLGVICLVILHDFIRQNYHKNQSDRYPFFLIMVNYPTFFINYHILNFQMYYQYFIFLIEYPKNASNFFIGNFWNRISYRNDCFRFLE